MELEEIPTKTLLKFCDALDIRDPSSNKARLCRQLRECANQLLKTSFSGAQAKKTGKKTFTRAQYQTFFRYAFAGLKSVVAAGADVLSFGGGANSITDLLFSVVDIGLVVNSIANVLKSAGPATKYVKMIYDIPWTGDPYTIREQMQDILTQVENDPNAAVVKEKMCEAFGAIVENIAAFFGSLVSALIPDSFGVPRLFVQTIISSGKGYAGRGPFEALAYIYSKLPKAARNALKDRESIEALVRSIVAAAKGTLPNPNDPFTTRLKKHVTRSAVQHLVLPLVPGGILAMPFASTGNVLLENKDLSAAAGNFIERRVVPNIPLYAQTMEKVLSLGFSSTLVFSRC